MSDEYSGSCPGSSPNDPGVPRRSRRRLAWSCGASSVRLSPGIAGCRSRRTRSLSGRLPEPNRRTNSRPRASSAFPARVMDEDSYILRGLQFLKSSDRGSSSWRPNDEVQSRLLTSLLKAFPDLDATKLRRRIDEFEFMVKRHLEHYSRIILNKELLLQVFSYVEPDFVCSPEEITASPPRRQKRTSICLEEKYGSDMEHHTKRSRSSCSESVHMTTFLEKPESAERILYSQISMTECTRKLQRIGIRDHLLCCALEKLKADFEMRQIFISLEDDQARFYILDAVRNIHD